MLRAFLRPKDDLASPMSIPNTKPDGPNKHVHGKPDPKQTLSEHEDKRREHHRREDGYPQLDSLLSNAAPHVSARRESTIGTPYARAFSSTMATSSREFPILDVKKTGPFPVYGRRNSVVASMKY